MGRHVVSDLRDLLLLAARCNARLPLEHEGLRIKSGFMKPERGHIF